jgi:hypothetical protein
MQFCAVERCLTDYQRRIQANRGIDEIRFHELDCLHYVCEFCLLRQVMLESAKISEWDGIPSFTVELPQTAPEAPQQHKSNNAAYALAKPVPVQAPAQFSNVMQTVTGFVRGALHPREPVPPHHRQRRLSENDLALQKALAEVRSWSENPSAMRSSFRRLMYLKEGDVLIGDPRLRCSLRRLTHFSN